MEGTLLAHTEGGVPNIIVEADGKTPRALGQLIYFFEYACGLSGYLLDVNPFDQPGVEAYKKNMFALLGKPGYEDRRAELEANLLFCIVFYRILCYAEHRITIPPAILFDRSDYYGQTDYGREGFR